MKRLLRLMLFLFLCCTGVGILATSPGMTVNAAGVQTTAKATAPDGPIANGEFGSCSYTVDQDGHMTIKPTNGTSGTLGPSNDNPWRGKSWVPEVTAIDISSGVYGNANSVALFENFTGVKTINMSGFNASNVTNMAVMFAGCSSLTDLNIPGDFYSNRVVNMAGLFLDCKSLESVDLSGFKTNRVTDMALMFSGCENLKTINWGNFNTQQVTNMANMFNDCSALTNLDLSNFQTDNVTNMYGMFNRCQNLQGVELGSFNTNKVENMTYMFFECSNLKDLNLDTFKTPRLTEFYGMFAGCASLEKLDLSGFNTSKVEHMNYLFLNCQSLTDLNLASFNTENVTSLFIMFAGCTNLQTLNLANFNTKKAIASNSEATEGMFDDTPNLWRLDLGKDTQLNSDTNLTAPTAGTALPDNSGSLATGDNWQAVADGTDHKPKGAVYSPTALADLTKSANFNGGRFVWEQTSTPNPGPNPGPSPTPSPSPSPSQPETTTPEPAPSPQPTPTPSNPEIPTTPTKPNEAATKKTVVYAVKGLYLYKTPTFTKAQRLVRYPKQKRINRPLFIVTGYARSTNGALRYKVRTTGPNKKAGYITANSAYVKPAYYQTLPQNGRVTIIATKGVNTYRASNLAGKVTHYKRGRHLRVKKLVKHNLTTRYQLSNGSYVTANKRLVIQGTH